jgi:chemotaxis signal transduction protein
MMTTDQSRRTGDTIDVTPNSGRHCWQTIGVYSGDHSCARLTSVVHCRNCPVYSDAARSFMLRDIPAQDRICSPEWAPAQTLRSALLMEIDGIQIGVAVNRVSEIAADAPLRRIPHRSGRAVAGLTNVRGQLHLTLALAQVFGMEKTQADRAPGSAAAAQMARPRIVLLGGINGAPIALRADHVLGVHGFSADALKPVPETLPERLAACVNAVGQFAGTRYLLLDDDQFAHALAESINA